VAPCRSATLRARPPLLAVDVRRDGSTRLDLRQEVAEHTSTVHSEYLLRQSRCPGVSGDRAPDLTQGIPWVRGEHECAPRGATPSSRGTTPKGRRRSGFAGLRGGDPTHRRGRRIGEFRADSPRIRAPIGDRHPQNRSGCLPWARMRREWPRSPRIRAESISRRVVAVRSEVVARRLKAPTRRIRRRRSGARTGIEGDARSPSPPRIDALGARGGPTPHRAVRVPALALVTVTSRTRTADRESRILRATVRHASRKSAKRKRAPRSQPCLVASGGSRNCV